MLRSIAFALTAAMVGCTDTPEPAADTTGSTGDATGNPTSDGSSGDRGAESTGVSEGPADSTGTDSSPADSSSTGGESGESTGDGGPPADCANLPAIPVKATPLADSTVSEDFTFDSEGNMLGISLVTRALTATQYDGTTTTILPDVSDFGRGVRVLPNGDYLVVDPGNGAVVRITPEGSMTTVLFVDDEPNGLAMHPNGMAYMTSGGGRLRRFDPDTGDMTVLSEGPSLDGIAFSVDYSTLYFNTEEGDVFRLSMDEDGLPTGEPSVFVTLPVDFLLDGMAVDECDNLYVVEMFGIVWRVSPDGEAEVAVDTDALIAAINFGGGVGGWEADHMYVMNLDAGVYEADLGVRGKPLPYPLP